MSLIFKIVRLCFIGVLAIVSIGILFPRFVINIYTNNLALIELGIPILYIVSVGALLLSIGFILFNGVSGTGKTNISLTIEVIVLVIYLLYAYTLVYKYNVQITKVWTAEIIYGSLLAVLSYLYLKSGKWKDSKI